MMTREELAQRITRFGKGSRSRELLAAGLMLGGLFLGMLLSTRFGKTYPSLQPFIGVVAVVSIGVPTFVFAMLDRRRRRALGLHCPECGTSLSGVTGRLAVTTCHCDRCGKKIVEGDVEPTSISCQDAAGLARRIDLFESGSRKRRRLGIALMFGGLLMVLIVTRIFAAYPFMGPVGLILIFCSIIVPPSIFVRIDKRHIRALGLSCPACERPLTGRNGRMAVSSLHCSQCGKKIVEGETGQSISNR